MEENREQILADFQSCTGMDDVAECIMHLDAASWNLLDAINTAMPQETQTLPSERRRDFPMEIVEETRTITGSGEGHSENIHNKAGISSVSFGYSRALLSDDVVCLTDGPSQAAPRILNFSVHYKDNTVPLEVPESETVATIKTALQAELGVPPCRQELHGWRRNHISDDTILSSLELSPQTALTLCTPDTSSQVSTDGEHLNFSDRLNTTYTLHIVDETNNKEYTLCFPGSKTILEIKQDIFDVTNIPVRFQRWVGWPESAKDESMTLAAVGTNSPVHNLVLRKEEAVNKHEKQLVVDVSSNESSDNEFEDASEAFGVDDDVFQPGSSSKKTQSLMLENMEDEGTAASHFSTEFANRYGSCHPIFFQGTLADALLSSCQKSAKERKPLAIYLHHDASVLTNVFCTQLLCSETVVSYLTLNFITWAWDLTFESNKSRFLSSVTQHLGMAASTTIGSIAIDHLPALMIIIKVRSTSEVLTVIPGNVSLDELMTRLIHAAEVFNNEMTTEIWEEEEREAREQVKREQDAAYEASLLADRAKEEARRLEEEERQKQKELQQLEKERQDYLKKQEEAVKEAIRQSLAEQLPPEPPESSSLAISHIRIRLPTGEIIARRFLASDTLDVLLMFIASKGFPTEDYKVLASWPRQDLTAVDQRRTLEELKLYPKETVTLEER